MTASTRTTGPAIETDAGASAAEVGTDMEEEEEEEAASAKGTDVEEVASAAVVGIDVD